MCAPMDALSPVDKFSKAAPQGFSGGQYELQARLSPMSLLFPAPLPIASLVAVPDALAPAVPLERRLVLLAVVRR